MNWRPGFLLRLREAIFWRIVYSATSRAILLLILGVGTGTRAGPLLLYISTIKKQLPAEFIGAAIMDIPTQVSNFWAI